MLTHLTFVGGNMFWMQTNILYVIAHIRTNIIKMCQCEKRPSKIGSNLKCSVFGGGPRIRIIQNERQRSSLLVGGQNLFNFIPH